MAELEKSISQLGSIHQAKIERNDAFCESEKKNRTLLDMVCSMLANSSLPNYLWREALRTAAYILNQVPSKCVP